MSPTSSTATNLRLNGINLPFARAVFVILSLATLIFFGLGVPLYYKNIIETLSYDIETLTALRGLGISNAIYATYQTSLAVLLAIGFSVAGGIIFRFKSDEWLALLVAFTLIGQGANAFGPLQRMAALPSYEIPVRFVIAMVLMGLPLSCYLFPDGKIQKRWMLYVAGFWFIWLIVSVFWHSFPINIFNRGGNATLIYLLSLLAVLSTGIYAQVHRYRNAESPIKREQLKWIVFGVAVGILTGVGTNLFMALFELTKPSAEAHLIADLATQTLSLIAQFTVPVAVVFSILKYRLYDIELVINRSLVYGSLTIFLAAIFGGVLMGLQSIFQAVTGSNHPPTLGIMAATVAVFSLFSPTLRISRRFVNQKIFGIDFDFSKVERKNAKIEKAAHLPSHAVANIGGYTGLELIARGGMGEIYKARHPSLNRTLAIKVLSSYFKEDPDFNKRFAREAEMMARLKHPNIINIYDYGEQDGLPYIVMEYLTGETLSHLLKTRTRLALEESLPLLRDLASALDYAHAQGIVHRDIKASNVIIEPLTTLSSNRTHRAVLMDFGIARFVSERTKLTITGDMLGTAEYISPEQIQGATDLDGRADQYSLGVLAYLMITGKKPFERHNTWAMIKSHLEEPPPDPRGIVPISESAAKAIMKAMAKKPDERFASAGEFVEALAK
jgi:tRNA A-37 threonylcarbamoyl transferase component Bud32